MVLPGAVLAAVTALLLAIAPGASAADGPVSAYPSPGTRAASAETQVSLRGRPIDQLGRIVVRGSRSGAHDGRLRAHSDGEGASFLPDEPFREGETVRVRTDLPIVGAGDGDFSVRIARTPKRLQKGATPPDTVDPGRTRSYRSRGDLRPPAVTTGLRAPDRGNGLLFMEAKPKQGGSRRQKGPMIVDDSGELVWFRPLSRRYATDVRAQRYRGEPVVTWWEGWHSQGMGRGDFVIADSSYRTIKRLRAGNGYRGDLHEFHITPRNTALVVIYEQVRRDLSKVGGRGRGIIVDSIVQELDIATGLVLFEWHSLGQVGYRESYSPAPENAKIPWDYVHANSVKQTPGGDLLVSGRNTWGVYKVDRASGRIAWRLGGKRNDFERGRGVRFAWQHDAQLHPGGQMTIFDNEASPRVRDRSRAITLAIDEQARTARLVRSLTHPRKLLAATQGNVQVRPDGRTVIGWGSQRRFSEFAPDGRHLLDGHLTTGYDFYRVYRSPWVGRPSRPPRVVAKRNDEGQVRAWVSWNGATEVARWQFLAGSRRDALAPVAERPRDGFETTTQLPTGGPYVAARALDAQGNVLGTSPTVKRR